VCARTQSGDAANTDLFSRLLLEISRTAEEAGGILSQALEIISRSWEWAELVSRGNQSNCTIITFSVQLIDNQIELAS